MGMIRPSRPNQPSQGLSKYWAKATMRGCRGQARPNSTPSAQLTWLATTSAAAGRDVLQPFHPHPIHAVGQQPHGQPRGLERQQADDEERDRHGDQPADQEYRPRREPSNGPESSQNTPEAANMPAKARKL